MYVLDTNTLIYFFKGIGNIASKLLKTSPKDIAIPSVVLFELGYGIAKSSSSKKRKTQLKEICSVVEVLPFGHKEAQLSAMIRAQLESKGTPIDPIDVLIASTALARQGTLITRNIKEFSTVSKLKIEDWYQQKL